MNIRKGRGMSVIILQVIVLKNQLLTLSFIIYIFEVRIHKSHLEQNGK